MRKVTFNILCQISTNRKQKTDCLTKLKSDTISSSIHSIGPLLFQIVVWNKEEKDLVELIPHEVLPNEYGGTAGSFDTLKGLFLLQSVYGHLLY